MKTLEKLEIVDYGYPIYHSDYITWMIGFAKLDAKKKKDIAAVYQKILGLIKNPDDILTDNIRIFINDLPFTLDTLKNLDIKSLLKELDAYPQIIIGNNTKPDFFTSNPIKTTSLIDYLKALSQKENAEFFYHTLPITSGELFASIEDHLVINASLLPYLRFLDLSNIVFTNVDLRGLDLSLTNIRKIDFSTIYKNSLENTNLEGVNLIGSELKNINADGSNLQGTYLLIDLDTTSINDALLDGTNIILKNGLIITNTRTRKRAYNILHF